MPFENISYAMQPAQQKQNNFSMYNGMLVCTGHFN